MRGFPFKFLNLRVETVGGVCLEKGEVTEECFALVNV